MHLDGNINIAPTYSLSRQGGLTLHHAAARRMHENDLLPFRALLAFLLQRPVPIGLPPDLTTAHAGKRSLGKGWSSGHPVSDSDSGCPPSSPEPCKNTSLGKQVLKRNLVIDLSAGPTQLSVFQARCLSRNTSTFTQISSEISSSREGRETAEGAEWGARRGAGGA